MTRRPGIFPTFFLSGFECSTFDWKDRGRRDLAGEPFGDPVELQGVVDAAHRLQTKPDEDWS